MEGVQHLAAQGLIADIPLGLLRQAEAAGLTISVTIHQPCRRAAVGFVSSALPHQKHEKSDFNKAADWYACVPCTGQISPVGASGHQERLLLQHRGDNEALVAAPFVRKTYFPLEQASKPSHTVTLEYFSKPESELCREQ